MPPTPPRRPPATQGAAFLATFQAPLALSTTASLMPATLSLALDQRLLTLSLADAKRPDNQPFAFALPSLISPDAVTTPAFLASDQASAFCSGVAVSGVTSDPNLFDNAVAMAGAGASFQSTVTVSVLVPGTVSVVPFT